MANQKLLSICIPTYNRRKELEECLKSILVQLRNKDIINSVEIIISDNNSNDGTKDLIDIYKKRFGNISYFRNKKNIGASANVLKVASYAKGKYIWFFADDDLQSNNSITEVIKTISKFSPDVILCNINQFKDKKNRILIENTFRINKDIYLNSKKGFFKFLEKRFLYTKNFLTLLKGSFYYPIEWFTTFASSIIVKKDLYRKTISEINDKILIKSQFPHSAIFLYTSSDIKIYLINKPLIYYRVGNISWLKKNQVEMGKYWGILLKNHYKKIIYFNARFLSHKFLLLVEIRDIVRLLNLTKIKFFNYLRFFSQ